MISTTRARGKATGWRHAVLAASVVYSVLMFVAPGHAMLYLSLHRDHDQGLFALWMRGPRGLDLPFLGAMIGIYAVLLVLAWGACRGGTGRDVSSEPDPMHWLKDATDSLGLRSLNGVLAAGGAVVLMVALWQRNPSLLMMSLVALTVAILGAEYGPAAKRESPAVVADPEPITLPMDPGAYIETSFAWQFRDFTRPDRAIPLTCAHAMARPRYLRATRVPRDGAPPSHYGQLLLGDTNPEVSQLALRVAEAFEGGVPDGTPFQAKISVLNFVQQFRLVTGIDSTGRRGYLRSPSETLWEREGTADCLVLLARRLLGDAGLDCSLLWIDRGPDGGNVVLALPGFDYIGDPADFHHDPRSGRRCALAVPLLDKGSEPRPDDSPSLDWSWSIGPLATAGKAAIRSLDV